MQKERAASALKHGLPVPTPLPTRIRTPLPLSSRSSSNPAPTDDRRLPIAVKLFGLGLAILGSIYGLTLFRDHQAAPEPDPAKQRAALESEAAILKPSLVSAPKVPASVSASAASASGSASGSAPPPSVK